MIFTTSWDDGHPLDLRLAEMLARHSFKGTFYVPVNNDRFGLPVMSASEMREVDRMVEIGSHTQSHCYLTTVDDETARKEIRTGRDALEDILGHAVKGFCYPGGKFRLTHRSMVEDEGFVYARTVENMQFNAGTDAYCVPTTMQLYQHSRTTYLKNWVRSGSWGARLPFLLRASSKAELSSLLRWALLHAKETEGLFHLWGHSWELERVGGWQVLGEFLAFANDYVPMKSRVTNHDSIQRNHANESNAPP